MRRVTCYDAVLGTLRADRSMPHSVSLLQLETGFSGRQIKRVLDRLMEQGLASTYDYSTFTYRTRGNANAARVPGTGRPGILGHGRCNSCNRFNEDGTVTEIQLGQSVVRACDHCLKDAGLCVKE